MPRGRPPLGLGVSPRATLRSFILLVSYERYFLVIRDMRRRGFRGVSAGEKEGFPMGFRRVSGGVQSGYSGGEGVNHMGIPVFHRFAKT